EAGKRRLARGCGSAPDREERREPGDGERPEREWREREDARGAGDERDAEAARKLARRRRLRRRHPLPVGHLLSLGLSTSREWILRLSARRTWKLNPSMAMDSPRLGSRPKRPTTRPPTVS